MRQAFERIEDKSDGGDRVFWLQAFRRQGLPSSPGSLLSIVFEAEDEKEEAMTQQVVGEGETVEETSSRPALPAWDLSDLYPGPDAPEIERDVTDLTRKAETFSQTCRNRVESLDGAAFGAAIRTYEEITDGLNRLLSYAQLLHAVSLSDPEIARFYQGVSEKGAEIATKVLFFTIEINQASAERLKAKMDDPAASRYAPWIDVVRTFREHQLDDSLERLLVEKDVSGADAWKRLFDETLAALRFSFDGEDLILAEILHKLSDRDGATRRKAFESLGKTLSPRLRLFGLILNTLAKDKEIDDRWRRYPAPLSARNLVNRIEDSVVEALVLAVKNAYPRLSHRYYALKAKRLGVEKLGIWDRNAPMPDVEERTYGWDEARDLVLSAYERFSPELAAIGRVFFDRAWIDAAPRPGKEPGAFAHPTAPSAHPYLLLNYMGRSRDVMTLAHELGHGIHQILAARQGALMAETPLTLAETASVFGEMLTFRTLLDAERDGSRRRVLLSGKVEDMLNTVVRQIAFHDFECRVHEERRASGELAPERLGEIWMAVQTESLGPTFVYDDAYRSFWASVPHFVHAPFYVYAYAFGDCLVNALYRVYESGLPGFQEKYAKMLAAGGTLGHRELLAPFGLDASDPSFWGKGLETMEGFIDELETL